MVHLKHKVVDVGYSSNHLVTKFKVGLDLPTLIESRLLIQANSGGGKSWAVRKLLESSHGWVQQIVIDLEGEFSTLREKFDYIIAGHGGDTSAQPRVASHLARRLLEIGVSAIVDLYELKAHDRVQFVRLFLESFMSAPKSLWRPILVVVDEAHHFCPEKGQAESSQAVIDLCTRGRKRGFCGVLATQRLSKLHKDACAELGNKLIGRTTLDIDQARAADELGISSKAERIKLRDYQPGQFTAYGPALHTGSRHISGVCSVIVGPVKSRHPKVGSKQILTPPKPTTAIRKVLSKIADLPAEAEQEARDIASLKAENKKLRLDLSRAGAVKPDNRLVAPLEAEIGRLKLIVARHEQICAGLKKAHSLLAGGVEELSKLQPLGSTKATTIKLKPIVDVKPVARKESWTAALPKLQSKPVLSISQVNEAGNTDNGVKLRLGARRMVTVLAARYPMGTTKAQLATLSRLRSASGTFKAYMSDLRRGGLTVENGKSVKLSNLGLELYGNSDVEPQSPEELRQVWRKTLRAGARRMFDILVERYPQSIEKVELAEMARLEPISGTYKAYLSDLRRNQLLVEDGLSVMANEDLF